MDGRGLSFPEQLFKHPEPAQRVFPQRGQVLVQPAHLVALGFNLPGEMPDEACQG
jgi:hypothetical protein